MSLFSFGTVPTPAPRPAAAAWAAAQPNASNAAAAELLESIKKASSSAFQAVRDDGARCAAFVGLYPLHALVRPGPLPHIGSFDVAAAERVLEFFGPPRNSLLDQESAEHYTPLMQKRVMRSIRNRRPTADCAACVSGDLDAARFFLDKGVDVNKEISWTTGGFFSGSKTHTALQLACEHGQTAVVQLLVERGADVMKSVSPGTPQLFAVLRNNSLGVTTRMELGEVLLPRTDLTNHWHHIVSDLMDIQALPLFEFLFASMDDKLKEWKFTSEQHPLTQILKKRTAVEDWVDVLLRNSDKFDPPLDVNNAKPILHACTNHSVAVIKTLLKYGAEINVRDQNGNTPIHLACASINPAVAEVLLSAGADPLAANSDGKTILHAAIACGRQALFLSLIEKGADPTARDCTGNSALGYAVAYSRSWAVDKLVTDENVDEPVQCMRRPILRSTKDEEERERSSALRKRLAAGKKPPNKNYEAENVLYEVVDDDAECRAKLVKFNRCYDSTLEQRHGVTPLLGSIAAGPKASLKKVLSCKPELEPRNIRADWSLPDRYAGMRVDITPFAYALMHGEMAKFKLLSKHARDHADVNAWMEWDGMRCQAIHVLLSEDQEDYIATSALSTLLSLGRSLGQSLEINNRDKKGNTPLHYGSKYNYPTLVWRLLKMGADPLLLDNWGNSALAWAAHKGALEVCRLLLSAGANINAYFQMPRKGREEAEGRQSLICLLAAHTQYEIIEAIVDEYHVEPEHMHELIASNKFQLVYHLLKKLRAENKLQAYLKTERSRNPLLALAKAGIATDKHAKRVVRALLAAAKEYGCTVRNEQGDTLFTALARRQIDASEENPALSPDLFASTILNLVEYGADLTERNTDGENVFHIIARNHQSVALLNTLLAATETKGATASPSVQNGEGGAGEADMDVEVDGVQSAPAADKKESIGKGSEEETLPEQGSLKAQIREALQARNARGQTPLLTAVRPYAHAACRNTEVMKLLLRLGANGQDVEQGTGNTALFYAVMTDNQAGVKLLLAHGLDINAANDKGDTPLFLAGRLNLWKMTLFLLLSGANPHAVNKAGDCVLLVSSSFCAAIIHDFVARPRSLTFISGILFPDLAAALPSLFSSSSSSSTLTSGSASGPTAADGGAVPSDGQGDDNDNGNQDEKDDDDEEEAAPKTLLDHFPEILHPSLSAATTDDTDVAETETEGDSRRKREQGKRQRMNVAVKQVTELLRRVLEGLQLYAGALDEADVAPDSGGDQSSEEQRRERWERNSSLTRLKEQLVRWLRKSEARIPRITRNLSFTTLSEGEMTLYLRQWQAIRRQRNQRKRKRGEEVEEDFFSETSSQPQEEWIDVKRPRVEGQAPADDEDDLPIPPLTVPEIESIPLPPPFVHFDDAVPFDGRAPLLLWRTVALVTAEARAELSSLSVTCGPESNDENNVYLGGDDDDKRVEEGAGLLEEEGYLLDAYLTEPSDVDNAVKLQALFARSLPKPGDSRDDEKASEEAMEVVETTEEEQREQCTAKYRFFVWDTKGGIQELSTRQGAIDEFKRRFARFTGHSWEDRANSSHQRSHNAAPAEPSSEAVTATAVAPAAVVQLNSEAAQAGANTANSDGQQESAMAVAAIAAPDAEQEKEEEPENAYLYYLPTNHKAVLRHREYSRLYGDGEDDNEDEEDNDNDSEESDGEGFAERQAKEAKNKEPPAEKRLYDMLAFVSHKKRLWTFCDRVGLFEITDMGQLTSAQIKNAHRILNVISGILTYTEEMKARKREVPSVVTQAIAELSNQFHRVLPFNYSANSLSLSISKRKILLEKFNLLQSLQEIGIGMEVLHEVALPSARRLKEQEEEEEELPTQDALSMQYDDDSQQQEKERLEGAAGVIDEDHPLPGGISSRSAQAMARMQLLCAALRARLTPVNKSSDAWKVILRLMATSSVTVLDAFKVEREGEKERFRAFAELPYRSLLCHGTGVYNVLGILRKGMCIAPKEANGSGTNFGKGLYFADFPDKSVSYMETDNGKGCFLLCDVALGEPLVRQSTGFREPLPPGRHHCWGMGRTVTHPEAVLYTDGGLRIPAGQHDSEARGMGHNEFIVYNEGQVRIRYLLLVRE